MKRFDVLDPHLDLSGHFFLEASAGTGKTFAIEHIVAKLLKEKKATLDQILVVTFTRASTRDLRKRIRATIEASGDGVELRAALCEIDTAPIFTIHGFCQRMLTEFGFEAGVHLGEMEEGYAKVGRYILDFMRTSLNENEWSPNQIALLLKGGVQKLVKQVAILLERGELEEIPSYDANVKRLYIAMQPFEGKPVADEFFRISRDYKGVCNRAKEPHEKWVRQIEAIENGATLDELLGFGPSVLEALDP